MNHILSEEELQELKKEIHYVQESISKAKSDLDVIINNFESNPVVQSFYSSGNFGKENQEALIELRSYVTQYEESINGSSKLIETTESFLNNQLSRVQTGQ